MSTPRYKRFKRAARLDSARRTFPDFAGDRRSIRLYARHYGVDDVCAILELRMLGVEIDEAYVNQLLESLRSRKPSKETAPKEIEPPFESDEWHSYIAGYTDSGFSYGVPRGLDAGLFAMETQDPDGSILD